ncbi:MAG: hypothetical protein GAK41_00706 [Burkholderia gladioli]|nr:MAG: hypothetical protein GAK41_00706 [Burkholderia gladioli]
MTQSSARETDRHRHPRGQLIGALSGLLSAGLEAQQWVVRAPHAIWVPLHHWHSLRSHGPFSGWSVLVEEAAARAALPVEQRAIRTNPLLREAVRRAATWPGGPRDADETRIAALIVAEIAASPAQAPGLPRPGACAGGHRRRAGGRSGRQPRRGRLGAMGRHRAAHAEPALRGRNPA